MITKTGQNTTGEYRGLSTDTKPTETAEINSLFLELDTGKFYYFDGTSWNEVGEE
jgi:hypothetical protein